MDVKLLEGVLDKTRNVVADVRPEMYDMSTPCPDYNVRTLVNHLVAWIGIFATAAEGGTPAPDAAEAEAGGQPDEEFGQSAKRAVEALRDAPEDRQLTLMGELPAGAMASMMLMEYIGHGWDLAVATAQHPPYNDDEARAALAAAKGMLKPEYQGPDKSFGTPVPVPADAPPLDQLIGFLGRDPERARS